MIIQDTSAYHLPDHVLDVTESKRALMVGGQIQKEESRHLMEKLFCFDRLDWVTGERGNVASYRGPAASVEKGSYDIVIYLSAFASHAVQEVMKPAAAKAKVPFVIVRSGASPNNVSYAIEEQLGARKAHARKVY